MPDIPPIPDFAYPPCDLFELGDQRSQKLVEKGLDPAPAWVRIQRIEDGRRVTLGTWPTQEASLAWLEERFGAGSYDVVALNVGNVFLARKVHYIPRRDGLTGTGANGARANGAAPSMTGNPLVDQLLQTALARALNPPADPMREAVAGIASLVSMQMQSLQAQVSAHQAMAPPAAPAGPDMLSVINTLVPLFLKMQGAAGGKPSGGIAEMVAMLKAGRELTELFGGKSEKKDGEDDKATEIVHHLIDRLGPAFAAIFAHATLKREDADKVSDIIAKHVEAEATGDVADPSAFVTPGESIP